MTIYLPTPTVADCPARPCVFEPKIYQCFRFYWKRPFATVSSLCSWALLWHLGSLHVQHPCLSLFVHHLTVLAGLVPLSVGTEDWNFIVNSYRSQMWADSSIWVYHRSRFERISVLKGSSTLFQMIFSRAEAVSVAMQWLEKQSSLQSYVTWYLLPTRSCTTLICWFCFAAFLWFEFILNYVWLISEISVRINIMKKSKSPNVQKFI